MSIIVPATRERHAITHLLSSIVVQQDVPPTEVIVVCNGVDDGTADAALRFDADLANAGISLHVIRSEPASKPQALNAGDSMARYGHRMYLDADVVLAPNAVSEIVRAFTDAGGRATICAPRILVRPSRSPIVRAYADVWAHMPYTTEHIPGVGCYAVNDVGRRRWKEFPSIGADDKFVRLLFAPTESTILDDTHFEVHFPESAVDLVQTRGRWTYNNFELQRRFPELARLDRPARRRSVRRVWRARSPISQVMIFAAVWAMGYVFAALRLIGLQPSWYRSSSSHVRTHPAVSSAELRVAADAPLVIVVVSYNTVQLLRDCLDSLVPQVEPLDRVVVVDNDSSDGSADMVRRSFPGVRLIENEVNRGFAFACNQGGRASEHDVVLFNSDAVADPGMLDALRRHRRARGGGLVVGGCSRGPDGVIDVRSCGRKPTLWSVACFAFGFSTLRPGSRLFDPESMPSWDRSTGRSVDFVTGAMMFVSRPVWDELDGLDERFFVYGEDVDFCLRAAELGIRSQFLPSARFTHVGRASSDEHSMRRLLLQGRITAIVRHNAARRGEVMRLLTVAGCAFRAGVFTVLRTESSWRSAWRSRRMWSHGFVADTAPR